MTDMQKYDEWFHRQVEESLNVANAPEAEFVPHDEISSRWKEKCAKLRDTLLAGITQENLHGEQDFGKPVGREEW